jgi:KaiC/GvpD/RAD55 family RecA-like ATPase
MFEEDIVMEFGKEIKNSFEKTGKEALKPRKYHNPASRVKTFIEGLDKMLNGGFIQGRNILLSGPCGSGKTTMLMQFVCNGALNGEKSLYVTLEEKKDKIMKDMMKLGIDVEKAEKEGNLFIIGGPIANLNSYMHKVDANIDNIIKEIEDVVMQNGIKRVAIDSINLLTMLLQTDEEKRLALASLCNTLSAAGCTSVLTSETKEHSMDLSRYGMEEFVVDGVIVLYLVRQGSSFVPGIVVRKMRGINHDKEIRYYQITDKGIVVYPEETMFADI